MSLNILKTTYIFILEMADPLIWVRLCDLKNYKCDGYSLFPMFNKHTTALYAIVISSLVVASVFAIGVVQQQASAQGNQTSAGGGSGNQTSNNSTSGGAAPSGSTTGTSGGNGY